MIICKINAANCSYLLVILIFLQICLSFVFAQLTDTESFGRQLLKIFIPTNYQKDIRPKYGGEPLDIFTSLYIIGISNISEQTSTFCLNLYFRHHWTDPRLAFAHVNNSNFVNKNISYLDLDEQTTNQIWVPDTFISNSRQLSHHQLPFQSKSTIAAFTRVTSEGKVLRSVMLEVVSNCQLDLEYFPFDKAICSLVFESYYHSMTDLQYHWRNGRAGVGISSDIEPLGWAVLGNTLQTKGLVKSFQSNRFKELSTELHLERNYRRFLICCYLPAALQAIIGFIFLALPVRAPSAPKSLFFGQLCLLLYSIGFTLHNFNQLGTSHLTLLDSYLITSLSSITTCWLLSIVDLLYRPFYASASPPLFLLIERKLARWLLPTLYLVYNLLHFACVYSAVTYHTGYEDLQLVKTTRVEAAEGAAESLHRGSSHEALFV